MNLLDPYLSIMMFNQSGRLVKKKKTTVKVSSKDPVFNETLNFEVSFQLVSASQILVQVAPGQLDISRFLITLCNKRQVMDMTIMEDMTEVTNHDSSDQEGSGPGAFTFGRYT